jgi:hypothetical protein
LLENVKHRSVLAKRLSSHRLEIESGRHMGIKRSKRKCTICTSNPNLENRIFNP